MDNTSVATTPAERQASLVPTALIAVAFLAVAIAFVTSSSSWYLAFKTVHVGFAVIWIGGGALLTVLGLRAELSREPAELASIARSAAFAGERIFAPSGLVVLLMGVAMMVNGDLDWGQFWVDAGLVGFASTFVTGTAVLSPWAKTLRELLATAGPAAPETQAAIKQILLVARVDIAVLLLAVVDMVAKPFS